MKKIKNYNLETKIYESSSIIIYRGYKKSPKKNVILKLNSPESNKKYNNQHEYEILQKIDSEKIIKAYDFFEHENNSVLVLEDFPGESIKSYLKTHTIQIEKFLIIAINIVEALNDIHSSGIIHKSINPSNILFDEQTGKIKIIDFKKSIFAKNTKTAKDNSTEIDDIIQYISPEQTGRMTGVVDYKTDFYSLGVTFYEMLTGNLPFDTNDVNELIHCHIAKNPIPPHELNSKIPETLSLMILKLLAKMPEERYQSTHGLKFELNLCLDLFRNSGKIDFFLPGSHDFASRFDIPHKLYGREEEIKVLLKTFEQINEGSTELFLISGYSGVGKTTLIDYMRKPIIEKNAFFISGKYEQYTRDIPYSGIIQAFRSLIQDLIIKPEKELYKWKEELSNKLGENLQVIIDLIPELEYFMGSQPELINIEPKEKKSRFMIAFQNFIQIFCQKEHPLVLILDDLQWIDSDSLDLIKYMMTEPDRKYLLIIGAYRENEVTSGHPLLNYIDEIKKENSKISQIKLEPLNRKNIDTLLEETLQIKSPETKSLSKLIFDKTNGNPFFFNQFLNSIYESKLLVFNLEKSIWTWDIDKIISQNITDNVVDLMIDRLLLLPEKFQNILKLASCIGYEFDLLNLSSISNMDPIDLSNSLIKLEKAGFIDPIKNKHNYSLEKEKLKQSNQIFNFSHDRVQQAAYSLIPDKDKQINHATIGRQLLTKLSQSEIEENIFHIARHLNYSRDLLTKDEKNKLCHLNLTAGIKARKSTAYDASLEYFTKGIELLPEKSWVENYELTLHLHQEISYAAFLSGLFEKANSSIEQVIQHGKTIEDKIKMYVLTMDIESALLNTPRVIELCMNILNLLGIKLEQEVPELSNIDDLIKLPPMIDFSAQAALPVLSKCVPAAFQSDVNLLKQVVYTMIKLTVKYGNDKNSSFAYVMYGLLLSADPNTMENGYRFGELGLKLLDKYKAKAIECRVKHIFNSHIRFTKDPIREAIDPMKEALNTGLATGDLEFVSYISNVRCLNILFSNSNLKNIFSEYEEHVLLMKKIKMEHGVTQGSTFLQLVRNLMGNAKDVTKLISPYFDETKIEPELEKVNQQNLIAYIYISKLIASYIYNEKKTAFQIAKTMIEKGYDRAMPSMYIEHIYRCYFSLAFFSQYDDIEESEKNKYMTEVETYQEQMKMLAEICPENYQVCYSLVEAEKMRVTGQHWEASLLFDQVINLAQEYQLVKFEAIANELCAEFWLKNNNEKFAKLYLRESRDCYKKWGSHGKVQAIEKKYPHFFYHSELDLISNDSEFKKFDIKSIIKSSQAISSEIDHKKLVKRILRIIIENAGAQKGTLVLENKGQLTVAATISGNELENIEFQNTTIESCKHASTSILYYVWRTKKSLILDNAFLNKKFNKDQYILDNKTKSILCTPLYMQTKPIGIIYLENNLVTKAFTEERLLVTNILASQAGISLENAKLFEEKKILFKEIHHRVKNNMAIISSFLNLQKMKIKDTHLQGILGESEQRIHTMAIVHEKLYQNENLREVNLSEYINDLLNDLIMSHKSNFKNIISTDVNIRINNMNLDTLIPLGLITNEIITNSLKHAFNETQYPELKINLDLDDNENARLIISDNGIGIKPDDYINQDETLGMMIINALVNQIGGKIEIDGTSGTKFEIHFPLD